MDSKDLLNMPGRDTVSFKLNYYLLLGGISLIIYFLGGQPQTLWINAYFLVFWLFFYALQRAGLLSGNANVSGD
jgi:hypothetical protein